jgi:leucyl-tRNA---protein transferase
LVGKVDLVYFCMFEPDFLLINEEFFTFEVTPQEMDFLLAEGWRNFGTHFFRHNVGMFRGDFRRVLPLRIRLSNFVLSKTQRRNLAKNKDLQVIVRPVLIDEEKQLLFDRHKTRFEEGIPESIYTFISEMPATVPSESLELCVYDGEKLLAVSFFNVGIEATSGIYAMFEPTETKRGLGIFTMLLEIYYAVNNGKSFYYQGYAYEGSSFYDYKKRFSSLEMYDWQGSWIKFAE